LALYGSRDVAQGPQKNLTIDAVLGASIVNRVKAGDWATNATHFEIEKGSDRRRVAPHHLVHQIIGLDWHQRSFIVDNSIEHCLPICLMENKLPDVLGELFDGSR
jgi:hypothetical protein